MESNELDAKMKGKEFLDYSGKHYEENKKKWSARLKKQGLTFSEDIYNDTILKVYEHINDYTGDIESYWYKAFLLNTKRDTKYSYHKKDDDIDVIELLSDIPDDGPPILLDEISEGIKSIDEVDKHIFLIYYLTDFTYSQLEELTGIKDIKYRLKKIVKQIKGNKKERGTK